MQNISLADDYLTRAGHRLASLEVLFAKESYADVVREAQEIVELCLKALLRKASIEVPRVHDVSTILEEEHDLFPIAIQPHLERMATVSRQLRRDRELAFYGSEDLTPSEFYRRDDATTALADAKWLHATVKMAFQ